MNIRSTGTHFGADVVSNHDESHGVKLSGGSTGGVVEPIGDDANIAVRIRGKGTGKTIVGNSSSPVNLAGKISDNITVGSSGTAISEMRAFTVQFTAPPLSSGFAAGAAAAESTITVAGVSTGTVLVFTPTNPINAYYNVRPRCSTVDELTLCFSHNGISTLGSGESTNRGTLLQFKF